ARHPGRRGGGHGRRGHDRRACRRGGGSTRHRGPAHRTTGLRRARWLPRSPRPAALRHRSPCVSHPVPSLASVPLEVVTTAYGRPALLALRDAVAAAKAGDPLAPVTVVVPSNHVGVTARRLLASGSLGPVAARGAGAAAVTFLTAYRLAELLGAPTLAAQGRRPVSTPVLAAGIRRALADEPGMFAPVAGHPATEAALVATYGELAGVTRGALAAL